MQKHHIWFISQKARYIIESSSRYDFSIHTHCKADLFQMLIKPVTINVFIFKLAYKLFDLLGCHLICSKDY